MGTKPHTPNVSPAKMGRETRPCYGKCPGLFHYEFNSERFGASLLPPNLVSQKYNLVSVPPHLSCYLQGRQEELYCDVCSLMVYSN